jgi:hypothetical protein
LTVNPSNLSSDLNCLDFFEDKHVYDEFYNVIEEELSKTKGLLRTAKCEQEKDDIMEVIQEIESFQMINLDLPLEIEVETHSRKKRQTSNCEKLKAQLVTVNSDIATTQEIIANLTDKVADLNPKIATYYAKYQQTKLSAYLSLYNSMVALKNSTVNALIAKKATLEQLQTQKVTLEAQIDNACATTTTLSTWTTSIFLITTTSTLQPSTTTSTLEPSTTTSTLEPSTTTQVSTQCGKFKVVDEEDV